MSGEIKTFDDGFNPSLRISIFPEMTMRDYFSAQMLASVFSAQSRSRPDFQQIAELAYKMADEMMKARKA
jgi:hypothetical protein